MQTTTITLAGKNYEICELPSRKAAEWRQLLQAQLGSISELIETAPETDISSGAAAAGLMRSIGGTLIGSTDIIIDLLFAYAPDLSKAREAIEAECFDSELIAAFTEVVKLAYPFGQLANLVARFGSGAVAK